MKVSVHVHLFICKGHSGSLNMCVIHESWLSWVLGFSLIVSCFNLKVSLLLCHVLFYFLSPFAALDCLYLIIIDCLFLFSFLF